MRDELLAGGVGGALGVLVGQPFDFVKVRMQTHGAYTGLIDCFVRTLRHDGITGMYRGATPPVLNSFVLNAINFGAYGHGHRVLALHVPSDSWRSFWAGCYAGLVQARVRSSSARAAFAPAARCVAPHSAPPASRRSRWCRPTWSSAACRRAPRGSTPARWTAPARRAPARAHALPSARAPHACAERRRRAQIVRTEGLRALYRGTIATAWRDSPTMGAYFALYEARRASQF